MEEFRVFLLEDEKESAEALIDAIAEKSDEQLKIDSVDPFLDFNKSSLQNYLKQKSPGIPHNFKVPVSYYVFTFSDADVKIHLYYLDFEPFTEALGSNFEDSDYLGFVTQFLTEKSFDLLISDVNLKMSEKDLKKLTSGSYDPEVELNKINSLNVSSEQAQKMEAKDVKDDFDPSFTRMAQASKNALLQIYCYSIYAKAFKVIFVTAYASFSNVKNAAKKIEGFQGIFDKPLTKEKFLPVFFSVLQARKEWIKKEF